MAVGIGVGLCFGGYLNPVLLDINFSALSAGGVTAPTGITTPCASAARTVQTGQSTVAYGIDANLALVGREQDWWDLGLVVEGPVANLLPNPRTLASGWSAGSSETFVAQSAGTDSPDNTVNSPAISVLSTGRSRYFTETTAAARTLSIWRRRYAPSARRGSIASATLARVAIGTGLVDAAWEKRTAAIFAGASEVCEMVPVDGRATVTGYSAAACSAILDMLCYESGNVPHEFYDGTKLGGGLVVPASKVVAGGRVSLYWQGRPKGSINGNNPWTYNPYIIYYDANNNVIFDRLTGVVAVTVAGAAFTCAVPINFSRTSTIELWIAAGGGSLQTVVRCKIDGVFTTLGVSTSPQGAFPNAGDLGICCKPADMTTGQFESWVTRVTFFSPGSTPTTFRDDPYQLFYDFTGLALGAPATPAGLTYACATAARTVQTGDATVTSGIAANAIRVGRERSKDLPGLVLEGAVTNYVVGGRNPVIGVGGWTAGVSETWTAQAAGSTSPDGAFTSPTLSAPSAGLARYAAISGLPSAALAMRLWINGTTARRSSLYAALPYVDSGTATGSWEARSFIKPVASAVIANVGLAECRLGNGFSSAAAAAYAVDFASLETGFVHHEFIDGTKAAETLSVPVASAVVNGRLGFYCRFRPKFSSASGTNPSAADQCLWYIDANNRLDWTSTGARTLVLTVAGVAYTSTNTMPTVARGDDWSLWAEAGNGVTVAWMYNHDTRATYPIVFGQTVLPAITGTSLNLLSTPTGTLSTECWAATARTYKTGRPDWQDPNILWRADFRRLQAGTDATPAGMTVTCATAARTVQVGDSQVVSGITNDVLLIGRESSALALGAVLEGAVQNLATTPRTITGWTAASGGETFTAQAAGIDSPDNTVISAQIAMLTNETSRKVDTTSTSDLVHTFWAKAAVAAQPARARVMRGTATSTIQTGDVSLVWTKAVLYSSNADSSATTFVAVEGKAVGYAATAASTYRIDLVQQETGKISHEWIASSKLGTVHSIPAAVAVSGGRLSLHYAMRPKGSIGGTNPIGADVVLWQIDANNRCYMSITGTIFSVINSVSSSVATPVTFARGDRIEWSYAGGGGTLPTVIKIRINDGAVQTLTLAVQAAVTTTGNVGLGCNPAAPGTNSLEGWYEYIEAYRAGTGPAWAV